MDCLLFSSVLNNLRVIYSFLQEDMSIPDHEQVGTEMLVLTNLFVVLINQIFVRLLYRM